MEVMNELIVPIFDRQEVFFHVFVDKSPELLIEIYEQENVVLMNNLLHRERRSSNV